MTPAASRSCCCTLLPRSTGAKNADGSPGLNLSGEAKTQFPFTAAALATDDELGCGHRHQPHRLQYARRAWQRHQCGRLPAAGPAGLLAIRARCFRRHPRDRHHAHRPGHAARWPRASACCAATASAARRHDAVGRGIHRPDQQQGPRFSRRHPDRLQGSRLRLRAGRGWRLARATAGMAAPSPSTPATSPSSLPRATRTNTEWYMLTGYTDWRGKHVFLDTQISAAYGDFDRRPAPSMSATSSATPPASAPAPCWRWAPIPA